MKMQKIKTEKKTDKKNKKLIYEKDNRKRKE